MEDKSAWHHACSGHRERNGEFSLLIRILQWPPREAEMRRTDEKRGSGGPEIDQN